MPVVARWRHQDEEKGSLLNENGLLTIGFWREQWKETNGEAFEKHSVFLNRYT